MKFCANWAFALVAAVAMPLAGCASTTSKGPVQAVSAEGAPFGGKPAVEIPSEAYAMGAYLKAEVASENGDRKEALTQYEEAAKFDPHNAALHVQIATLYVRDGRLKEALDQSQEAIALDPTYVRARLLAAWVETALGDDSAAVTQYQEVMKIAPKNQES